MDEVELRIEARVGRAKFEMSSQEGDVLWGISVTDFMSMLNEIGEFVKSPEEARTQVAPPPPRRPSPVFEDDVYEVDGMVVTQPPLPVNPGDNSTDEPVRLRSSGMDKDPHLKRMMDGDDQVGWKSTG